MQQFDKISAVFVPRRTDDLVIGAADFVDKKIIWQASWLIEDGPYAGEWAMTPCGEALLTAPFAWVPSGDLKNMED